MVSRSHGTVILCWLLSGLLLLSSAQIQDVNPPDECNRSCGNTTFSYPFGFSEGCTIRLNCDRNSGNITVGGFPVKDLTSDRILISLPASCTRQIAQVGGIFGENYAPTWRNGFLLENCRSAGHNNCVTPSRLISSGFGSATCDSESWAGTGGDLRRTSCYSTASDDAIDFLNRETVMGESNCSVLFSSILMENSSGPTGRSFVTLELHTAELGWWVAGECNCDSNATCTAVVDGGRRKGFRCNCKDGYTGDGFVLGDRCRKVSECRDLWSTSDRCGGNKLGIMIGGIIAVGSLVGALAFICYCVKKRSISLKTLFMARRAISESSGNSAVPSYPYKEIDKATNGFSEKQRLGSGAYGTVYVGKLHNDQWVAIKKIRHRDNHSAAQVMNEIKVLSSVSHPNLVRLLGCCMENSEQILVYEYMPNGTLSQHLQRERGSVLPWTVRLAVAVETAHAIAHLHSAMNPPIFHRDIKSSNILLDSNFNSKVADFGLSRFGLAEDSHISTAPQGTPGYVDPQYHQNFHLSDKSDVYSFGVVLVEIISAMKVVDFSRSHSEINLAALAIDRIGKGRLEEMIDPYLEPNRDAWTFSSVHRMAEIAFRCLSFHRDMRPSMTEVAYELEQIRQSSWERVEEDGCVGSSVASSCSSLRRENGQLLNAVAGKKSSVQRWTVDVPTRYGEMVDGSKEAEDCSPVSVQDPWRSDQSSPSSVKLLGSKNV